MKEKTIYTLGWEIPTKKNEDYKKFVTAHRISKADFENPEKNLFYSQLDYQNDQLSKISYFENGILAKERKIKSRLFFEKLRYFESTINTIKSFRICSVKTDSFLGGTPTDKKFQYPKSENIKTPFQHIAELKINDKSISSTGKKINLVYPLFSIIDLLFLDYSNPNKPTIFNDNKDMVLDYIYGIIPDNQELIFEKNYLEQTSKNRDIRQDDLILGIPDWVQEPIIPISPVTKKPMKFLCQITTNKKIRTIKNTIRTQYDYFEKDNEYLNFGDGNLYAFHEEKTNLICLFTQVG